MSENRVFETIQLILKSAAAAVIAAVFRDPTFL